jgi:hypothetical protein
LSLEEVKGRRPVVRDALEMPVSNRSFDNPVLARHFEGTSSGSRSAERRTAIDFDHLTCDAARVGLYAQATDLADRPLAVWFPPPPAISGYFTVLMFAKDGIATATWFSQNGNGLSVRSPQSALQLTPLLAASRRWGVPIPTPEPVSVASRLSRPASVASRARGRRRLRPGSRGRRRLRPGLVFPLATSAAARLLTGDSVELSALHAP